jgi:hypothetical protein
MRDSAYGLPRIGLLGSMVNKARKIGHPADVLRLLVAYGRTVGTRG